MDEKYDLIETAKHAGNFRLFVQALESAGLKDVLKETGTYTVLAPVDDAFIKLPQTTLHNLFKSENRESLRSVLRKHIIPGKLLITEMKEHDQMRSVDGEELRIESRADLWINEAQVITPDLKASNGVLHGIDTVLIPETQVAAA